MRIFCVANQKGGVGKTTTTVNLAAGLAKLGRRVPWSSISIPKATRPWAPASTSAPSTSASTTSCSRTRRSPRRARRARKGGYDVVGANRELAGAEVELVGLERRDKRLRGALAAAAADYDFVLIDCPPSLSLLTLNGLSSAHGVVVPMQCEYFALEGLSDLVNTIKQVHANLNPALEVIGILRVMFDARITLQSQVSEQLKAHFGDKVFDTVIPRNVRLAEAPSYGMPGVVFDPALEGRARLPRLRARDGGARRRAAGRAGRLSTVAATIPAPFDEALLARDRGRRHQRQRAARAALGRRLAAAPVAGQGQARALHPGGRAGSARHRRQARPVPAALRRGRAASVRADHAVLAAGRARSPSRRPRHGAHRRHAGHGPAHRSTPSRRRRRCATMPVAIEATDRRTFAEWVGRARGSSASERRAHAERIGQPAVPHHAVLAERRSEATSSLPAWPSSKATSPGSTTSSPPKRARPRPRRARLSPSARARSERRARRWATCRSTPPTRPRGGSIAASASPTATRTTTARRPTAPPERRARGARPARSSRRGRGGRSSTAPRRRSRPCRGCRGGTSGSPGSRPRTRTGRRGWCRCTPGRRSSLRSSAVSSPSGMTRTKRSPA